MRFLYKTASLLRTARTIGGACVYAHKKQKEYQDRKKHRDEVPDHVMKDLRALFLDRWMILYDPKEKVFLTGKRKDLCVEDMKTVPLKDAYQFVMDSGDEEVIAKFMEFTDFRKLHNNLHKEVRPVYRDGQVRFEIVK